MNRMTTPRGRLPARVYWFRRGLVLVVALVLVFAIGRVLSSFGGDDAGGATTVAQTGVSGADVPDHVAGVTLTPRAGVTVSAPLSQPTGACADDDVKVVPDVRVLSGGGAQPLTMLLSTTTGGTCTWRVSPGSLVVKLTSRAHPSDRVWSSQDCPGVVPRKTVVVRPPEETRTRLSIAWGGHRSLPGCPPGQDYVGIGAYTLEAASLGGDPTGITVLLVAPPRPQVTRTASARPSATASADSAATSAEPGQGSSRSPSATPSEKPSKKPSQRPSQKPD